MVIDNKVTQAVQDWLNTPEEQRDIRQGAELMLSLNRNRALYNSVLARPAKYKDKMIYELRKHLRMRLDNMAVADVIRLEERVIPSVKEIIAHPIISTDDEFADATIAKGKRADHDTLPTEIKALWDRNITLYRQIVLVFNELKAMEDCPPCDRYERLVILDKADKEYRANFARYDDYKFERVPLMEDQVPQNDADIDPSQARANARKNLSKYIKKLETESDAEAGDKLIDKICACLKTIYSTGGTIQRATAATLAGYGITISPTDGCITIA